MLQIQSKVAKENSREVVVQERIITWYAKKSADQLQYLPYTYLTFIIIKID